jgi:hypothetical protein
MIRINTRMPDALWVDMKAQVASCRVAEKRILSRSGARRSGPGHHRGHPPYAERRCAWRSSASRTGCTRETA